MKPSTEFRINTNVAVLNVGDPGSGKIAGNNATIASITQLPSARTRRTRN